MKIYTKLVYAWQPDGTPALESAESFDYEGPLALAGKSKPPPAPDYAKAAEATSTGNLDMARLATKANRVDQYDPYGQKKYTSLGDDRWREDVTLSPTGQKLLGTAEQSALGLADLQGQAGERVNQGLNAPFDYSSVGDVSDASYGAQTARLDPQWNERADQERTRLANQGLAAGGEAYDSNMRNFEQARTDAYGQARMNAISTQPQTYQLAQALRSQPLNELNALRTGSQVQNPSFNVVPQQQTTTGPNYLGAAQSQYGAAQDAFNSEAGSSNNMMSGLMGIGGSIMGGPIGGMIGSAAGKAMSDRRLKRDIKRIGTHPRGFGVYAFRYLWDDAEQIGVMADEVLSVLPEAVLEHPSGYLMVDYGRL